MEKTNLFDQWQWLWERLAPPTGDCQVEFEALAALYGQQGRYYHTLTHIEACLAELSHVRHLLDNPEAVEFALWYHDAVYEIGHHDNEEKSALLAAEACRRLSLPEDFAQAVHNLILATKHQGGAIGDGQYVADIDLSIFAKGYETFLEYEKQIRKEYVRVPSSIFVPKRFQILESFLDGPVYYTEFFRQRYEVEARRNVVAALARLHCPI